MADALLKAKVMNDGIATEIDSESNDINLRMTRSRQLFVSDWRHELLLAGFVYHTTVGTITGGGDVSLIQGGGAGTTIDQDQPELAIGIPTGYALIPLEINFSGQVDLDANAEVANFVIWMDLAANVPTDGTKTTETPVNMLLGATDYPGTAYSAYTVDVTDSTVSEILFYKTISVSEFVSNGAATNLTNGVVIPFSATYEPKLPMFASCPCGLYVAFGGTAAVNGIITATWATPTVGRYNR